MQPVADQKEEHKKQLEVRRKTYNATITAIYNAVNANNKRMDIIKDPVAKNLIPVYMISSIVDIISVVFAANLETEIITEDSAGKIAAITDIVSSRLNLLIEWIQSPVYAPSHPVGQEMMNESKREFEKLERSELVATIEALKAENERLRK